MPSDPTPEPAVADRILDTPPSLSLPAALTRQLGRIAVARPGAAASFEGGLA